MRKFLSLLFSLLLLCSQPASSQLLLLGSGGTCKSGAIPAPTAASQFTATNSEFLSIADNASLSFGDEDFSFGAWAYLDSKTTHRSLVMKYTDATPIEYGINYNSVSDRFHAAISGNGTIQNDVYADALGSPSTGTWYFVVAVHDSVGNTFKIYINGSATVNSVAHTAGCNNGNSAFLIGAENTVAVPTFPWDGRIAKAFVYRKALSTTEIDNLYNSGNGLADCQLSGSLLTSLEGYWNLSESSGTRADSTANANNLADNFTVTGNPGIGAGNCL